MDKFLVTLNTLLMKKKSCRKHMRILESQCVQPQQENRSHFKPLYQCCPKDPNRLACLGEIESEDIDTFYDFSSLSFSTIKAGLSSPPLLAQGLQDTHCQAHFILQ